MLYLLVAVLAYLIGSFPSGVVVVRIARGIDVRRIGSRRSGATNVLRAAGVIPAAIVFLLDLLKGAGPVWLGMWLAESTWVSERWSALFGLSRAWPLAPAALDPLWAGMIAGLAAIAGHNWPIYVRFRGGRGVTTSLGTLVPLAPVVAIAVLVIGVIVIILTRYVSLGSVVGASLNPIGLLIQTCFVPVSLWVILYGVLIGGLIDFQHRDNIARLLAGTERRVGEAVPMPPEVEQAER